MSDSLKITIEASGIATLTMSRGEVHNAFDDVLISEMTDALLQLEQNPDVQIVILAAEGKSFSAGADLGWMQRMAKYSEAENLADAGKLASLMRTLDHLKKPTIAAVQGAAFGGGVGLVACCDIVVAAPQALFCLSEVKLGLIPAVISPYVIQKLGIAASRRYFLTAERFDAETAARLGLVHEIVAREEVLPRAHALATAMLANSPQAMAEAKRLIRDVALRPVSTELIDETARRIAAIRVSAEGQDGLNAFLEKRQPGWIKANPAG
ncbi:enoyl-CoA hydratase/isomerase family protein [Burkholderiaceae bacterium DAT-1]|nr:enoyl-CoA hydratase/isomerase family protein [Burkholderiaceae bacterium DAT-1]